ncbi:MAG TPA: hypothetical protein VFV84_01330, partial [Burkholderiales bacterium]|nr:hypothetical protein [Burkholderiales bacterium]
MAATPQEREASASRAAAATGSSAINLTRRVAVALLLLDVAGLVVFFDLAFWLRLDELPWFTPGMLIPLFFLILCLYVLDTFVPGRQVSGMRPPARAIVAVLVAALLTGAAAYAGGFWSVDPTFGRGIFPVAFLAQAFWSAGWRLYFGGWVREQAERIRWLVIGTGEQAQGLREDFERSGTQGELVVVDEAEFERRAGDALWSGVVVALTDPAPEQLVHQLMDLRFQGVRVYGL